MRLGPAVVDLGEVHPAHHPDPPPSGRLHSIADEVAGRPLGQVRIAGLEVEIGRVVRQDPADTEEPGVGAELHQVVQHLLHVQTGVDLAQVGLEHPEGFVPPQPHVCPLRNVL